MNLQKRWQVFSHCRLFSDHQWQGRKKAGAEVYTDCARCGVVRPPNWRGERVRVP